MPMLVKDELVGDLASAAADPYRFERDDEHLLGIIAGQIGVAVQNARLHDFVRRGKQEWEHTFDAISDAIAVFDSRGRLLRGNSALGTRPRAARSRSCAGSTCHERRVLRRRVSAVRGWRGRACTARPDASRSRSGTGEIFSVTTFPVVGDGDGAVGRAGREERDRGNPVRAAASADERRARLRQRPADRDGRAAQVDAGAAPPVGEAVGDRSARRRRRARVEQPADERHRLRAAARGGAARRARRDRSCDGRRSSRRTCGASSTSRSARRGSSATCWRSRAGRPPRARRRTSPSS